MAGVYLRGATPVRLGVLKTAQVVLGVCTSLRQCTSGSRLVHRVLKTTQGVVGVYATHRQCVSGSVPGHYVLKTAQGVVGVSTTLRQGGVGSKPVAYELNDTHWLSSLRQRSLAASRRTACSGPPRW